ncbi:MAG: MFS transporter [Oscillatoriaceae cyanobacterium Prado104]|nr:MFS transporter [Oscillatoriaceae cyanobacterium Prado104]
MMRLSDTDLNISVLAVTQHKMEERENFPNFHSHKTSNREWNKPSDPAMEKYPANPETAWNNSSSPEPAAEPPQTPSKAVLAPAPDETPETEIGFLPVLKNRNFLALWSGQVFSQLADKVYLVLTIAIAASRFQAPDQTIPAVLFGAAAGVYVDRWSKKAVLVATNLLRGGLVLMLPLLLWASQGWELGQLPLGFCLLMLVTFLVSTLTQFFSPAEQAVIPLIVERRHLLAANSLYTTTMMGSVIIGFAVGEPLLALADTLVHNLGGGLGIGKELAVGGSYALAGVLLLSMKTGEKNEPEHEPPHPWADLQDGLRYIRHKPSVRNALIQLIILFSIFAALTIVAVRLAEILPGMKASQFGFLLASAGVGMAAGAASVGSLGRKLSHSQLSLIGSAGMSAALIGMSAFTHSLWMSVLLITVLGWFASLVGVPMQTTIQAETPEEMRGKVFGLQNNATNIALSLPLVLAGAAETFLGLPAVFLGLGVLAIAGGVLTWYISGSNSKADRI